MHNTSRLTFTIAENGEDNVGVSTKKSTTVESLPFQVPQWRELNNIEGPNQKTPPFR